MLTQEADTRPALSNSRSRVRTPGMRLDSRGSIIFAAVVLTIVIGGAVASMLIPQFDGSSELSVGDRVLSGGCG